MFDGACKMALVLVTGSRDIKDYNRVAEILQKEIKEGDEVVHGDARYGVDILTTEWCKNKGVTYHKVPPLNPSNKISYLFRNAEMVGMCDRVVGIWDGKSRGSKFTIDYAKERGKPVSVY